jgi:hypothetical protein
VDEIPRMASVYDSLKLIKEHESIWFHQPMYYYYLNNFVSSNWNGTRMVRGDFFLNPNNHVSMCKSVWKSKQLVFENGGWHFSWMGNAKNLSYKMSSFMHQEWNSPVHNNLPALQKCLDTGADFWGRPHTGTIVKLDDMPKCVSHNPSSYANLLREKW